MRQTTRLFSTAISRAAQQADSSRRDGLQEHDDLEHGQKMTDAWTDMDIGQEHMIAQAVPYEYGTVA